MIIDAFLIVFILLLMFAIGLFIGYLAGFSSEIGVQ
jgi:hypothetical protein